MTALTTAPMMAADATRLPRGVNYKVQPGKTLLTNGNPNEILFPFKFGSTDAGNITTAQQFETMLLQATGTLDSQAMTRSVASGEAGGASMSLAMSSRNFARFYRATEDFYRRIYRTVRYNPEAIRRAALTYEGIRHSGFVQQDDNGDSYFFYPGLNPVYQTMQGVADAFGMPEGFKVPMPVEFGAKLNMITPSMNPDSLFPTFSGPVAALPMKFLFALVPQLDSLEKNFLGIYAQDQPMINAIFPAHVNRLLAAMNRDERNSQYASAARKAATALEAGGHGVKPTWNPETEVWEAPSEGELLAYKDKLQTSTFSALAIRFIFGFFAPASPQVTLKSDMAQWARDNERVNFKQVYNNLINRYNGDIDRASTEWISLYPDQMRFEDENGDWVKFTEEFGSI